MFRPGRIGSHDTRNRIVRSATNDHLANLDGTISDEQVALYETLAKNQVGVIITGHFGVDGYYKAAINQPLISDDSFIPEAAKLSEAAHAHGAVIYGQISQGGLNGTLHSFDINTASVSEIEKTVSQFAEAAYRLEQAGYDGVQVHLAHGYFLANVLDPTVNQRTDLYGGSDENRFWLVREILLAIREKCSPEFDLLVKLSANNKDLTPYDDTLLFYAKELEKAEVDAIELSGTNFTRFPHGEGNYFLREALLLRQAVNIPVLLVGGVSEKKYMEQAMQAGIDFVSCARAFICDPEYVTHLMEGQEKSRCVGCWQCFRLYSSQYKNCVFLGENPQLRDVFGERQ